MPSVSAIILTYDRLSMLKRAVASARWQTHGDLQIVVVANGSPPSTLSWLRSIDDPRLHIVALDRNRHPSVGRNAGLDAATGEWVGFLDDDDMWAPDKVEVMVSAAMAAGRDWAYCGAVYVDPDGRVLAGREPDDVERVLRDLPIAFTVQGGLSGMMWRAAALGPDGRIDERMSYCSDWDVALRLHAKGLPAPITRPLMGYRQHAGSWSFSAHNQVSEIDLIAEKHVEMRHGRGVLRAEHHRYVAAEAARAGDRSQAIRQYLRAIRLRDLHSVPRLAAVLLPLALQRLLRRVVLSHPGFLAEGRTWVDALHQMSVDPTHDGS